MIINPSGISWESNEYCWKYQGCSLIFLSEWWLSVNQDYPGRRLIIAGNIWNTHWFISWGERLGGKQCFTQWMVEILWILARCTLSLTSFTAHCGFTYLGLYIFIFFALFYWIIPLWWTSYLFAHFLHIFFLLIAICTLENYCYLHTWIFALLHMWDIFFCTFDYSIICIIGINCTCFLIVI